MQKENRKDVIKRGRHAELDSASSTQVVTQRHNNGERGRFQIKFGMTPLFNNGGFTLIELLVVVLIIGILAAVALPQYEKSVWKSRAANMRTLMSSVAQAANAYILANGENPTSFGELAVDIDSLTAGNTPPLGGTYWPAGVTPTDWVRYNDQFEIILGNGAVVAHFITGKYKYCGFIWRSTGEWNCREWTSSYYKGAPGSFCQKVMGSGPMEKETGSIRFYPM